MIPVFTGVVLGEVDFLAAVLDAESTFLVTVFFSEGVLLGVGIFCTSFVISCDFVVGDIVKLNSVGTDLGVCGTVEKIYPISPRGEEVVNVEVYDYDVSYEGCANFLFCKC